MTPEGIAVTDIASRPGLWLRAGMEGKVSGLDHAALAACLPAHIDRDRALALAAPAEIGLLEGFRDHG